MKFCQSCGMPLMKIEDFANSDEDSLFCCYCVNDDGVLKSAEEIFNIGVGFFMIQFDGDREKAEKVTRKNMSRQPYWQEKEYECLKGEMVSDEEFEKILKEL